MELTKPGTLPLASESHRPDLTQIPVLSSEITDEALAYINTSDELPANTKFAQFFVSDYENATYCTKPGKKGGPSLQEKFNNKKPILEKLRSNEGVIVPSALSREIEANHCFLKSTGRDHCYPGGADQSVQAYLDEIDHDKKAVLVLYDARAEPTWFRKVRLLFYISSSNTNFI